MHADEELDGGVVPRSREQGGRVLGGDRGGRDPARGERRPDRRGPDTASGYRVAGLIAVHRAARQSKSVRFTALLRHVNVDLLKRSYLSLARDAAPGIDGVTWQAYGEPSREIEGPARPSASGSYRAHPARRTYIPKADGEAATQHLVPGGQDRPTGGRVGSRSDLRGGLSSVVVSIPTGAPSA